VKPLQPDPQSTVNGKPSGTIFSFLNFNYIIEGWKKQEPQPDLEEDSERASPGCGMTAWNPARSAPLAAGESRER
jgi:hypothetical protein